MGFQIATNTGALKAYNALSSLNSKTEKAQLRLATQKRINSVADDTSGFNVGKSLDQKVKLMQSAQGNVGSAKDMLATAESQLISIKDMITQIKAKQADATNPAADKGAIANDIKALADEIVNAFATTKFNDTSLLMTGSSETSSSAFSFQTGAASTDKLSVDYRSEFAGGDTVDSTNAVLKTSIATELEAMTALSSSSTESDITGLDFGDLETAVDNSLGQIGNYTQRLDAKDDFLTSAIANSQASVSRLFDADMAMEQLNATKSSIGAQSATSMLAQLNFAPQQVLQLLG
jgi:flagellin